MRKSVRPYDAERLPDGDTYVVTPGDAESAAEFFASFFSCSDKADVANTSLILKSIDLFEPGKFIQRAIQAVHAG